MASHLTRAELQAGLPHILGSPEDDGVLEAIVIRPGHGLRQELQSCEISLAGGTHGDHWAKGCWMSTDDGKPHPDVQICIMNARCIAHVAQQRERWALVGDNLFIDLDIRPENLPPGQRLRIGTAVIEITDTLQRALLTHRAPPSGSGVETAHRVRQLCETLRPVRRCLCQRA